MSRTKKRKKPQKSRRTIGAFPGRRQKRKFVRLQILPDDLWLKVSRGKTLWEALEKTDVPLEGDCGGMGQCGKCKIKALSSLPPPSAEEKAHLTPEEIRQGIRLACRTTIRKDLAVRVGDLDEEEDFYQILRSGYRPEIPIAPLVEKRPVTLPDENQINASSDLERITHALGPGFTGIEASLGCLQSLPDALGKNPAHGVAVLHDRCLLDWQPRYTSRPCFGLVFDLGTSTLVGKLIDLETGAESVAISRLNAQIRFGTNIISRIQYVMEHRQGLRYMSDLLMNDLNRITRRLLEVENLTPEDIHIAVAAGNTTMQHFLLRMSPEGIAGAPFRPVSTEGLILKAKEIGFRLNPECLLYVMPSKSGYIGGDMIGTILASGAAEQDEKLILALDLGTNGEIFLGNRKKMAACSAAAGPALEGAAISNGLIAKAGAIEGVRSQEGTLAYHVIGNIKPKGICGSGLADLAAVLLHCGVIDTDGLILPPSLDPHDDFQSRVIDIDGTRQFMVASAGETFRQRPIFLTQKDVRELQLAKGAIAAGIQTLLDELSVTVQDIDEVHLAGALGNYINHYSAMRIGLLPQIDAERIKSLGNAASTGAAMVLLCKAYWQKARDIAHAVDYIELYDQSDFNRCFIDNLDFPAENIW